MKLSGKRFDFEDKASDSTLLVPKTDVNLKSSRQVIKFSTHELKILSKFRKEVNKVREKEGKKVLSLSDLVRLIVLDFIASLKSPFYFVDLDGTLEKCKNDPRKYV